MSETETKAKAKPETVYETIKMTDGREVSFAGNRKVDKTVIVGEDGNVTVRLDFRNGETRSLSTADLARAVILQACGHGLSQKIGDNFAGVKEVDDMVLETDDMLTRLRAGDWSVQREAGDSAAGASVVIKALVEHTGKSVADIKAFLQGKLDKAKAAGQKLSRQDLYNSFRVPSSPVAGIIKRLEEERMAKSAKANAVDLLAELG